MGGSGSSRSGPAMMRNKRLTGPVQRTCVFAGPSLSGNTPPARIDLLPPATRGSLAAAVRAGYTRIGLIDGAIEDADRLPLGELRQALATPDVEILGGASMGAVRAAQLGSAGMRGVGRVFRLFRRGSITNSDEVYVLHAPEALRYRCLTLPLVNVRYTLRAVRRIGCLAPADEHAIIKYLCDVPWFDRDRRSVSAAVYAVCGRSLCTRVMQAFDSLYRDIKRDDALCILSALDADLRIRTGGHRTRRSISR
jgi:hypothetical protein